MNESLLRSLPRFVLGATLLFASFSLTAQPAAPTQEDIQWLRSVETQNKDPYRFAADTTTFSVDLSTRAQARSFYNAIYPVSDGVPIAWTGTLTGTPGSSATGTAGTTSGAFKNAVLLRINWFRAMAGIPATITFNDTYSAKSQEAALMMSANNALSHYPPTSWLLYTATGAEAASNSNLSLGRLGPDAITNGYIFDPGSNNAAAGHRRWLLYPQSQIMGSGDISPSGSFRDTNATWVVDSHFNDARPTVRDSYVAWPPKGYVPYPLVFPRWSFSYPKADFSGTTVSMTRDGIAIQTTPETLSNGAGENTFVWAYNGLDTNDTSDAVVHPKPTTDTVYTVKLTNVLINGVSNNYSYNVTVFDPAKATAGDLDATVSGISGGVCTVPVPAYASGFQWREITGSAATATYGADGGLQGVETYSDSSYNVVDTATKADGTGSYHLAQPSASSQWFTLPGYFTFSGASASVNFKSRLSWATSAQVARVQISTDDGASWADAWTQAGSGNAGESSFSSKTVTLDSYAGRTIRLRFAYTFTQGSYYPQSDSSAGWHVDTITFSNLSTAVFGTASSIVSGSTFPYSLAQGQTAKLQARIVLFNAYPDNWGTVSVVSGPTVSTTIAPTSHNSSASADSYAITVTSGASWIASADQSWVSLSPTSGSGNGSITVSVQANTTSSARSSNVSVGGQTHTLTQDPLTDPGRLVALSVRGFCGTGAQVQYAGYIIKGSGTKRVVVRGVGPGLLKQGVTTGYMANPFLTILDLQKNILATNDNWSGDDGSAYGPAALDSGSKDSVLYMTHTDGVYTAQLNGVSSSTGEAMVEVYDTERSKSDIRLTALSIRAQLDAGQLLIPGLIIGGSTPRKVIIRALGPTLTQWGLSDYLPDPTMTLYSVTGAGATAIATNDNWSGENGISIGLQPYPVVGSKDAVLVKTLDPGNYSVIVSGNGNTGGIVLFEVYEMP